MPLTRLKRIQREYIYFAYLKMREIFTFNFCQLHTQRGKSKGFYLLFGLFFLFSCKEELPPEGSQDYFDLGDFIQKEAARLKKDSAEITKTVFLNGDLETRTMTVNDWNSELNAFAEADISKRSYLGKYAEETAKEDTRVITQYTATDDDLRTRVLDVTYGNDGAPVKIHAILYTTNVLYSTHQQLTYERDKGFWISGKQTIRFLEPDTFSVAATFEEGKD